MKVLLVTESYWPNADGGALFERRLVRGLIDKDIHMEVWAPGVSFRSYEEFDQSYTIHREKSVRFLINPKYRVSYWPFFRARRLINLQKPDLIHIHNMGLMGLSALFWAKRRNIPVLGTNHFMPENALLNLRFLLPLSKPLTKLIWNYLVFTHNRCNYVTSPTSTAINLLIQHDLKAPSQAITNGIDVTVFHDGLSTTSVIQKYNLPKNGPRLLYLGRVDGEKRLDLIISALTLIRQDIHLVVAGAGIAKESLVNQAARLGVANRVTFTGYIDEADKPNIYNTADAFIISSPAELQSIVMLEAMACSLPLLAVDVAALNELCHDGTNGYLFPRDDWKSLAQRVNQLMSDPSRAKLFGQKSRNLVEKYHSTEITFERYEQVYRQLASQQVRVRPLPPNKS